MNGFIKKTNFVIIFLACTHVMSLDAKESVATNHINVSERCISELRCSEVDISRLEARAQRGSKSAINLLIEANMKKISTVDCQTSSIYWTNIYRWTKELAKLGSPFGQIQLGDLYRCGRGVRRDVEESNKWYRSAKTKLESDTEAIEIELFAKYYGLSKIYLCGLGTEKDISKFIRLVDKGAALNIETLKQWQAMLQMNKETPPEWIIDLICTSKPACLKGVS